MEDMTTFTVPTANATPLLRESIDFAQHHVLHEYADFLLAKRPRKASKAPLRQSAAGISMNGIDRIERVYFHVVADVAAFESGWQCQGGFVRSPREAHRFQASPSAS